MNSNAYIDNSEKQELSLFDDEKALYHVFFGDYPESYMKRKETIDSGKAAPFAWYAFILSLFWLLYRKMYAEFFIIGGIIVGLEIAIELLTDDLDSYSRFINLLVAIGFGFGGNLLYIKKAKRTVTKAMTIENEREKLDFLRAKGGTSYIGPIIFIAISIGLTVLGTILENLALEY